MFNRIALPIVFFSLVLGFAQVCRADGELPSELRKVCTYHPSPDWWAQARAGQHGRVVCRMTIDPHSGEVTEVTLLRKTRFARLNAAVVLTALKWRFQPHTVTQVTVPFQLDLYGYYKELYY